MGTKIGAGLSAEPTLLYNNSKFITTPTIKIQI